MVSLTGFISDESSNASAVQPDDEFLAITERQFEEDEDAEEYDPPAFGGRYGGGTFESH